MKFKCRFHYTYKVLLNHQVGDCGVTILYHGYCGSVVYGVYECDLGVYRLSETLI